MKISIELKNKKKIFGEFLRCENADEVVVFLTWFSGGGDTSLLISASKKFFLARKSTFRFNFYGTESSSLKLKDVDFNLYLLSLKQIVDYFSENNKKIVLVGHSFGAIISILFLKKYPEYKKNTKLVLWDPAILPFTKEMVDNLFIFNKVKKLYCMKTGKTNNLKIEINEKMYKDLYMTENTVDVFSSLNIDACIVGAEKGAYKNAEEYFSKTIHKKTAKFFIINKTGHLFGNRLAKKELFSKTIDFLV